MTGLQWKAKMQEAKQKWGRGEITTGELYAVADEWIEYIREYKRTSGNKKLRVPSRSYLIRSA